jgi:hypothetical protein
MLLNYCTWAYPSMANVSIEAVIYLYSMTESDNEANGTKFRSKRSRG